MRELAEERKRFGAPRLHVLLKQEGLVVNHKRTERIYREERLCLRRRRVQRDIRGTGAETSGFESGYIAKDIWREVGDTSKNVDSGTDFFMDEQLSWSEQGL